MPTRRSIILTGAAAGISVMAISALARDNPMPPRLRQALERDPTAPVLGNPKGDITLTEFFDYNCPFCRRMVSTIQQLIASDPNLRVVYREWPVFGQDSVFATRASLASLRQGKYWQFHSALMAMKGRANEASAMRTARQVGLDVDKLRADMDAPEVDGHIEGSMLLAEHMGLAGTPTFIAGDDAVFGQQSLQQLQDLIALGRKQLAEG